MIRMLGGLVGVPDEAEALAAELERGLDAIRAARGAAAAPAARVLRGMGRPADLRHPLGRGAGRDRRRRPDLSRAARREARRRIASSTPSEVVRREPGRDRRVVVRQAGAEGDGSRSAAGMGRRAAPCATATSTRSSRPTSCSPAGGADRRRPASFITSSRRVAHDDQTAGSITRRETDGGHRRDDAGVFARSNSSSTARRPSLPRSTE